MAGLRQGGKAAGARVAGQVLTGDVVVRRTQQGAPINVVGRSSSSEAVDCAARHAFTVDIDSKIPTHGNLLHPRSRCMHLNVFSA